MNKFLIAAGIGLLTSLGTLHAEDAVLAKVPPVKLDQLKRMAPLSKEKVFVFVESGQLSKAQANTVLHYLAADGHLDIPTELIGEDNLLAGRTSISTPVSAPTIAVGEPNPGASGAGSAPIPSGPIPIPRMNDGTINVLAWIRMDDQRAARLSPQDSTQVMNDLRAYRRVSSSDRAAILRSLGTYGEGVNPLIALEYTDPIDLDIKVALWTACANPGNPRAAGYMAATHNQLMRAANPILIPFDKDAGGLILRRRIGTEEPRQRWYESRDLRNKIIDLEESISYCGGVRAVSYLMDLYAARYETDEAPMRDDSRDRKRMVRACGHTDVKEFNDGDPKTWSSNLAPQERAMIAERLIPHLNAVDNDTRKIARDGLLIALGVPDKDLKKRLEKAHDDMGGFINWWSKRREELLNGR